MTAHIIWQMKTSSFYFAACTCSHVIIDALLMLLKCHIYTSLCLRLFSHCMHVHYDSQYNWMDCGSNN